MNFLSSPDVSTRYGIPLRTVQAACSSGAITATKFGRVWLIEPTEAEAYAARWRPHRNGHIGEE